MDPRPEEFLPLPRHQEEKPRFSLAFWITVLVPIALAAIVFFRLANQPYYPSRLAACRSNLKNLATALDLYADDYHGHYPPDLRRLLPGYLKTLPTCPGAGKQTYRYELAAHRFSLTCVGENHADAFGPGHPDYPRYDSEEGLTDPLIQANASR